MRVVSSVVCTKILITSFTHRICALLQFIFFLHILLQELCHSKKQKMAMKRRRSSDFRATAITKISSTFINLSCETDPSAHPVGDLLGIMLTKVQVIVVLMSYCDVRLTLSHCCVSVRLFPQFQVFV